MTIANLVFLREVIPLHSLCFFSKVYKKHLFLGGVPMKIIAKKFRSDEYHPKTQRFFQFFPRKNASFRVKFSRGAIALRTQYELPKSYFKKKFSCEPKMEQILTFFNRCKSSFQDWCRAHTDLGLGFQCDMALPSLLSNHLFCQLHPPACTNNNKTS